MKTDRDYAMIFVLIVIGLIWLAIFTGGDAWDAQITNPVFRSVNIFVFFAVVGLLCAIMLRKEED